MNARTRLEDASLYLCTDARRERGDLVDFVRAALDGGVDIVQLRDKGSPGEREFGELTTLQQIDLLGQIAELTKAYRALLAVNDRADLAAAVGADVLH
ncbi:MAG: thiamine phosphate synthase, partial [Gordonia sp. (in: high G+C Gram-positive bacteria)]